MQIESTILNAYATLTSNTWNVYDAIALLYLLCINSERWYHVWFMQHSLRFDKLALSQITSLNFNEKLKNTECAFLSCICTFCPSHITVAEVSRNERLQLFRFICLFWPFDESMNTLKLNKIWITFAQIKRNNFAMTRAQILHDVLLQ